MEISLFVLAAIIVLLVIVIYGLGKRYHQAQNRIKELDMDLSEYVEASKKDARTINQAQNRIKELEMDLQKYVDASLKDARTIHELNKKLEERKTQ